MAFAAVRAIHSGPNATRVDIKFDWTGVMSETPEIAAHCSTAWVQATRAIG